MTIYQAPYYSDEDIARLEESEMHFPFSDRKATYLGLSHQYQLTSSYFEERGINIEKSLEDNGDPQKVEHFLQYLRFKVYNYIYTHSKSSRPQLNYLVAVRGLRTFGRYEYREAFLEAMFIEGCYLLTNGDLSQISGVDLDTMQSMSAVTMRNEDRDMDINCINLLKTLGLNYYGRYNFPMTKGEW